MRRGKMTNAFRNSIFAFFLTGLLVATMLGCAGPTKAAKTGFLKDYSQLKPHPEIEGRHRYINPNIDLSKYRAPLKIEAKSYWLN